MSRDPEDLREIQLRNRVVSQAVVRSLLDCNPDTGELTWKRRPAEMFKNERLCRSWNGRYAGKNAGSHGVHGYMTVALFGLSFKYHRVVWIHCVGDLGDMHIDHINGDRSDNRLCNLRVVTVAENAKNKAVRVTSKSGVQGVSFCNRQKQWVACIVCNGRRKHLGYFDGFEDAVAARKAAEAELGFHKNHGRKSWMKTN